MKLSPVIAVFFAIIAAVNVRGAALQCCEIDGFKVYPKDGTVCSATRWDGADCLRNTDFQSAKTRCEGVGARLCTGSELREKAGKGSGCKTNIEKVWTSDECETGDGKAGYIAALGKNGKQRTCYEADESANTLCCAAVSVENCDDEEEEESVKYLTTFGPKASFAGIAASGLPGVASSYDTFAGTKYEVKNAGIKYLGLASTLEPIGRNMDSVIEAGDAKGNPNYLRDGKSGDTDTPHGKFMPLWTVTEHSPRDGYMPPGNPTAQNSYLVDDDTLRMIFTSELYGAMGAFGKPSALQQHNLFDFMNPGAPGPATFTGSRVNYIDYNVKILKELIKSGQSTAGAVKSTGNLITDVYNLLGNKVDDTGDKDHVHFSDTSADGNYTKDIHVEGFRGYTPNLPDKPWTWNALGGTLSLKEQWGPGLGLSQDTYMASEIWTLYLNQSVIDHGFVGVSVHAIDLRAGLTTGDTWAAGAFGQSGYEKVEEFNCGVTGYVCFALSGYNGAFSDELTKEFVDRKKAISPTRADGTDWVYTENISPPRIYIGAKTRKVDGTECVDASPFGPPNPNACSFLESNGLAYGKVYGFAVDDAVLDRNAWHNMSSPETASVLDGFFAGTGWQWDGEVKNYEYDQAWDWQEPPVGLPGTAGSMKFWNPAGRDTPAGKQEQVAADPRGNARFIDGSAGIKESGGFIGMYDMTAGNTLISKSISEILGDLDDGALPDYIPAKYHIIEGAGTPIASRVDLGGKGIRADGNDHSTAVCAQKEGFSGPTTYKSVDSFAEVDALTWIAAKDGDYVVVAEDARNAYGERVFMFKVPQEGVNVDKYYFLGVTASGDKNSRAMHNVCIPAATATASNNDPGEISGVSDMSGALYQTQLGGYAQRQAAAEVAINDKSLTFSAAMIFCNDNIIQDFGLVTGGQILNFQPDIN